MRRLIVFVLVLTGVGALLWWWRQRQTAMENDPWSSAVTTMEPDRSPPSAVTPTDPESVEVSPPAKKATAKSATATKSTTKKSPAKKAAPKPAAKPE